MPTGRFAALVWLSSLCAVVAQDAAISTDVQRVARLEGVIEYRLANGLRALLIPEPSASAISINMTYLVGSRDDAGDRETAHLLEHLLTAASANHPDIKAEQRAHGARMNGSTWADRTTYFGIIPASRANLEWALDVEADRMINGRLDDRVLAKEVSVVQSEREITETQPSRALTRRVLSTAFRWHPYGNAGAEPASEQSVPSLARLRDFYAERYRPDNAVLIVGGPVNESAFVPLVVRKFGAIQPPTARRTRASMPELPQEGERTLVLSREGSGQAVVIAFRTPGIAHPETPAVELLSRVVVDRRHGPRDIVSGPGVQVTPLHQRMVDESITAFQVAAPPGATIDSVRAQVAAALDPQSLLAITEQEIETARATLLSEISRVQNDVEMFTAALSEYSAAGDWRLFFAARDRLRLTMRDDVRAVARYFTPNNRTVAILRDSAAGKVSTPPAPDLASVIDKIAARVDYPTGERFETTWAAIESGLRVMELPPGIKLRLLPKRTRGGVVAAVLQINYGDAGSLRNRATAAELTPGMLSHATSARSRDDIGAALQRIDASMSVTGADSWTRLSLRAVRDQLAPALRLAAGVLRYPRLDANSFAELRAQRIATAEAQRGDPFTLAITDLARRLNPYDRHDVRHVRTIEERLTDLRAARIDDIRRFHREFFGASSMEVVIVGDFDPQDIAALIENLFSDWRSRIPYRHVRRDRLPPTGTENAIAVSGATNVEIDGAMRMPVGDGNDDYLPLVLASSALSQRLTARIRGREALSYSVGVRFNQFPEADAKWRNALAALATEPGDTTSDLLVFAVASPANAAKAMAALREEIAQSVRAGFSREEIEQSRAAWLQSEALARSQDNQLMLRLRRHAHHGRSLTDEGLAERRVATLAGDVVNDVYRRYVTVDKFTFAVAGPVAGSKQ